MFFKILMRNNEGGNEKQEIYLVWPMNKSQELKVFHGRQKLTFAKN